MDASRCAIRAGRLVCTCAHMRRCRAAVHNHHHRPSSSFVVVVAFALSVRMVNSKRECQIIYCMRWVFIEVHFAFFIIPLRRRRRRQCGHSATWRAATRQRRDHLGDHSGCPSWSLSSSSLRGRRSSRALCAHVCATRTCIWGTWDMGHIFSPRPVRKSNKIAFKLSPTER